MPVLPVGGNEAKSEGWGAMIPMIRVVICFPYSGYQKGVPREELFWKITQACADMGAQHVIVVLDHDTITRGDADAFLRDARVGQYALHVHRTWSVDTCDRWLAGWGVALGRLPCTGTPGDQTLMLPEPDDDDRIVLLPGDIDEVAHHNNFFNASLPGFLAMNGIDIVVGDFETGEKLASKDLIDLHGTYPLFALWFPEIAVAARDKSIWKPRSEFVNVRAYVLRELLLSNRRFAYEQTLNMLIHSWDFESERPRWRYRIAAFSLGEFADDPDARNIPGAIDQIERTERMLKMVWREIEFGKAMAKAKKKAKELASPSTPDERNEAYKNNFRRIFLEESAKILRRYDHLEATSRSIEAAARVTVLSFIAR
jgi:hypothetical protein